MTGCCGEFLQEKGLKNCKINNHQGCHLDDHYKWNYYDTEYPCGMRVVNTQLESLNSIAKLMKRGFQILTATRTSDLHIFSTIFCGSLHKKCGENAELKKCGENMEIIQRKCGEWREFGLRHFHEVYNAEKWDLEHVEHGNNVENWTYEFSNWESWTWKFWWKFLKVTQPLVRSSFFCTSLSEYIQLIVIETETEWCKLLLVDCIIETKACHLIDPRPFSKPMLMVNWA